MQFKMQCSSNGCAEQSSPLYPCSTKNEGDFVGLRPRKISWVSGNFWGIRDGFPNYLQSLCGVRKMSVGHPLLIKPALRIYQETPPSRSISTDSVKVGSSLRECRMLLGVSRIIYVNVDTPNLSFTYHMPHIFVLCCQHDNMDKSDQNSFS